METNNTRPSLNPSLRLSLRERFSKQDTKHKILVITIIVVSLIGIGLGLYFLIKAIQPNETSIVPDQQSQSRMDSISQVMQSYFGQKWPAVMILFAVFIFLILVLVYFLTKKDIAISDQNFATLKKFGFIFG